MTDRINSAESLVQIVHNRKMGKTNLTKVHALLANNKQTTSNISECSLRNKKVSKVQIFPTMKQEMK